MYLTYQIHRTVEIILQTNRPVRSGISRRGWVWVLALMCWSSVGYGQYFSRHYSLYAGTNGYVSSIQVVDDTIYAMCYVGDSVNPAIGTACFERFDKYGNVLSINPLNIAALKNIWVNNNNLIHTNDGGFAYGGYIGIDSTQNALVILKYDRYANFQWYKEIIHSNSLAYDCDGIIQDSSSNYYFTGIIQHTIIYDVDMHITKTDSNGNLIYTKDFLHANFDDFASGICFNNKGHVIIGGDAISYNLSNLSTAKDYMEIYELDTAGNQLNHILGTDTNGTSANNILQLKDGGYLIASSYYCYKSPNTLKGIGSVAKLDSNFNVVWRINTGPCSQNSTFFSQKLCSDGSCIAIGQWYDDTITTTTHKNGWVMKYTGDGQVLWSKLYRGVTSLQYGDNNALGSLAFMSDGSIISAGQATNNDDTIPPSQQGWLLHLDTAGCLPDSNNCGLPDGIINIPQTMGSVKAYPNPASDQIQFEIHIDQPSASTLYITNMLGQEMSETFIPQPITNTSIDVRGWPTGLYVYRVSAENGFEMAGRFVVER